MGLFRYIVQGIGWEIGRSAAREGIDSLREGDAAPAPEQQLSKRELARLERERAKQAERERKEREAAVARREAAIDAELRALKKKAKP